MRITYIFIILSLTGCAEDHRLIGKWVPDSKRTLEYIRDMEPIPEAALKCFEDGVCGRGGVEYTNETYKTVLVGESGEIISVKSAPYEIVEKGDDYLVVDQFENGGKFKIYFEGQDISYVRVKPGFNDYYVRVKSF